MTGAPGRQGPARLEGYVRATTSLTRMLTVAHAVTADAGLTGILLAVNYHIEVGGGGGI